MISIRSSADMARALAGPIDAPLRRALEERRDQLMEYDGYDLGDLAHLIVVRPSDSLAAIEAEAGFPIVTGTDGQTFESVARHGGWIEAVTILSDDGFGVVLLVPDCVTTDPALLLALLARA